MVNKGNSLYADIQITQTINTLTGIVENEKQKFSIDSTWVDYNNDILSGGGLCFSKTTTIREYNNIFDFSDSVKNFTDLGRVTKIISKMMGYGNALYSIRRKNPYKECKDFATNEDISQIIGLLEERTRIFMDKMIRLGVFGKISTGRGNNKTYIYFVNPAGREIGAYISIPVYFLFEDYIEPHISETLKNRYFEHAELYISYTIPDNRYEKAIYDFVTKKISR